MVEISQELQKLSFRLSTRGAPISVMCKLRDAAVEDSTTCGDIASQTIEIGVLEASRQKRGASAKACRVGGDPGVPHGGGGDWMN